MERKEKITSRIVNRKKVILMLESVRTGNKVNAVDDSVVDAKQYENAYYQMRSDLWDIIQAFETLNRYDEIELGTL